MAGGGRGCPPPTFGPTTGLPNPDLGLLVRKHGSSNFKPSAGLQFVKASVEVTNHITLFQCNIGGDPKARLAKGSVLGKLLESRKPTFIILTETKRKRRDIPKLPNYHHFTLDPLEGSSGGIVFYYDGKLSFRTSIAHASTYNSILWTHLRHHISPSSDLYFCAVYAPTANSPKDRKLSFYRELSGTTSKFLDLPGQCILAGDFNARIGDISGDHATNSNMRPFLEFLEDHPSLTNINTLKAYGKYTFVNISNGNCSIVDYLLTDLHPSKITEHTILPGDLGTSAQTAHKALFTKISLNLKEEQNIFTKRNPKWRILTEKNRERYTANLKRELSKITVESANFKTLIAAINRSKTNSLGRMRPRPPTSTNSSCEIDLMDTALGIALEKHRLNPCKQNLEIAQSLERELRIERNKFELKTLLDFLNRLEGLHQAQKMRLFYKKIKMRTQINTNSILVIRNPDSTPNQSYYSSTKEEYLNFWTRYLEKTFACAPSCKPELTLRPVLSFNVLRDKSNSLQLSSLDQPLTRNEVSSAINSLKNMKAAGLDEITNEDIKLIDNLRPELIHLVLQKMWNMESCPAGFRQSIFYLFPKPGKPGRPKDLRQQKNYRPIALLSAFRKVYESILSSRILNSVTLNLSQFGFLPGKSTSDCIFLLVEAILEARYAVRGPKKGTFQRLYAAFVDFKGAFDCVFRDLLWQKMATRFGIKGKLLRVIMDLYTDTTGRAIINDLTTESFSIHSGVLQGSVLGPTLFLLFLDDLLEDLHASKLGISMGLFILSVIAYADDVTLLSNSQNNLQQLLDFCSCWAIKNGMSFGFDKCFAVVFNSRTKKPADLPTFRFCGTKSCPKYIATYYPEDAPELYVGFNVTDRIARTKLDSSKMLPHSLVPKYRRKPNPAYLKLIKSRFTRARHGTHQLCSNKTILTPRISIRLYKTLQRSTLLYALEFGDWDLDQINELETLQAKALRTCLNADLQCPQTSLRLFSGVEPLEARRDLHTLLYYAKLCRYSNASLTGMIHRNRTTNRNMPVGFHCSVRRILSKYGVEQYWDNVPDVPHAELISLFKKPIWLYHWLKDVASCSLRDSPFSIAFIRRALTPTWPYKSSYFMNRVIPTNVPNSERAPLVRFWMTPSRTRLCTCNSKTSNLAKHLIFDCPLTRELMAHYILELSPELLTLLDSSTFSVFLNRIACSSELTECFNRVVGKFAYPLF